MDKKCNFTALGSNVNMSQWLTLLKNCSFGIDFENFQRSSGPDKNTETAFKLIFYSLAAIENIFLLYVMYRDPLKRLRNSTSYFVGNLAIADLVSIISGLCHSVFQLNPEKVVDNQEIAGCFSGIGVQCSFLMTMIFAIDRYTAIVHPYKYKNIMRRKPVLITLIVVPWCFAVVALPLVYFHSAYRHGRSLTNLFAGNIIVLTVITLAVHPLTHRTFKRKIRELSRSSYVNKVILAENLKINKVLATTVLMVSACLIMFMSPYIVAFSFSLADCNQCFLNHVFQSFWKYYPLLTAVRLMTNSLVYAWRLPLYRESMKALIFNARLRLTTSTGNFHVTKHVKNESSQTLSTHLSRISVFLEDNNNKNIPGETSKIQDALKVSGLESNAETGAETTFDEKF